MKFKGIILLLLFSAQVFAQHVNGIVTDRSTGTAVPNALIKLGYYTQLSTASGDFVLGTVHFGDTIKVFSMGYKPYVLIMGMKRPDTIHVYLEQNSIILNNVTVEAKRNAKLDSANVRKEFDKIFAYKAPTIADAFVKVDPYVYTPANYITSDHSTASLVGIDLLSIASLFGPQKTHATNLQAIALKDEEISYVDRRFSKKKITSITNLQGKPLNDFIIDYRPDIAAMKQMSDYDLIVYIKKSYDKFTRLGGADERPALVK